MFVVQLGALLSLYVIISFLLTLLFSIINIYFPDALQYGWEYDSSASSIRIAIASLLVFFPTFLLLGMLSRSKDSDAADDKPVIIKWFLYISLLIAGGVLLGNLVVLILSFLEGELTIRFILKVCAVFIVVGSAFGYYVLDIAGFWSAHKNLLRSAVIVSVIAILASATLGFFSITGPSEAREISLDARQVSELKRISYEIESYTRENESLPNSLEDVYMRQNVIPTAPEGRSAYEYIPGNNEEYKLCAEFMYASQSGYNTDVQWTHDAGRWCFDQSVSDLKR